jgi:acyl-CoA synthetase (NDP forming)
VIASARTATVSDRRRRLERLLDPASLAFIGGDAAVRAIGQCRALGFDGEMWAVNPTRAEMNGVAAVPSVADLPGPPDAAFVAINRHDAVTVVGDLATRGTGVAVCYPSGFAESGPDGASLQDQLVAAAGPMPVLGPNCYGTISATSGAALWPDEQGLTRTESGVAIVTQSGNIAVNLTMQTRGLAIAHVITLGNQCDVAVEDMLDVLVDDPPVTGIALHIEGLRDVGAFGDAVGRARRRGLPVVALKTGSSDAGATIAASHTASLVGADDAYSALFERIGARRVRSIPELLDTLHVLDALGPLDGRRIISLSCSGGEASLVADRANGYDIDLPTLDPDHTERIRSTLPEIVAVSNPLDYHTFIWGNEAQLTRCFTEALDGPIDAAMLVLDFPRPGIDAASWWPTLRAFGAASRKTGTPGLVAATLAETMPADVRSAAIADGLAVVTDIDAALRCLEAGAWWGRSRGLDGPDLLTLPSTGSDSSTLLDEVEAKSLLAEVGVEVPRGEGVDVADAADTAERLGFPVVVKALGLGHKTEVGGVRVGLGSRADVDEAALELRHLGSGLLVEELVEGTVELLIAVRQAPPVGYVLTLGAGGTLVEVLDHTQSLLLPAPADSIRAALAALALWPVLAGHRGRPSAAVEEILAIVDGLTELVADRPEILQVEINPLIVGPDRAVAADALVVRGDP